MNSIANADMRTIATWIAGGWHWWLRELRELMPTGWRQRLAARAVLLDYHPQALSPLGDAADRPARSRAAVTVILPAGLCLVRTIELPRLNERDLDALIALDSGRIMPFAGTMVIAGRIVHRDPVTGRMRAEVAGLPHVDAMALGAALRLTARAPAQVLVSAPESSAPPPIDLLPALRQAGLVDAGDRSLRAWWLAAGFLFALNIGLLIWRDAAAVDDLQDVVSQQQPAVMAAQRIIARIQAVDRIAAGTLAARRDREPLAMLARIDQALPPGAWLQRLNWAQSAGPAAAGAGDVRLTGYRPPHVDVSAALRRSGMRLLRYDDAANTADTPLGQPFDISTRLERR